jgi:hypothetical protein
MPEAKENILDPRPGEVVCDISARLFLDSKRFVDVGEWTMLDALQDLSRVLRDSKVIVKRAIIKSYNFPYLKK